jgi:hypothetical protein
MTDQAQLVKPEDAGRGYSGMVKRWMMEIDLASNAESGWRRRAEKVMVRYRAEGLGDPEKKDVNADTFNVLYANVQTLAPIMYNSVPEPVVERRNKDADAVAKAAAEVLRRAIKYSVSGQDFAQIMQLCVLDFLLPGRAAVAVKYMPTMAPITESDDVSEDPAPQRVGAGDQVKPAASTEAIQGITEGEPDTNVAQGEASTETAAPTDEVVDEEIAFDLVNWKGFRRGPGRTWQDVPWVAFELDLTREASIELFGKEIGEKVPMRSALPDDKENKDPTDKEHVFQRAKVWQIWDKAKRQIVYVSPDYKDAPLKISKDEYNLRGFYNIPRPMYAIQTSDSLVPVCEFTEYQTLADEAENLTNRMAKLARTIRARLAYDASMPELEKMLQAEEADAVPIKNAMEFVEKGGMDAVVWFWPIDKLVEVYSVLSQQRDKVVGAIFELMGIGDVMRGQSDPDETYGAQRIKEKWGTLRTRIRQAEVQRFARDLMCLAGELIAEKFSVDTLKMVTGLYFPMAADKQKVQQTIALVQQQAAQAQATGQQPPQIPPDVLQQAQQLKALPTWEDIMQLLRSDVVRHFRIDIQTDSTIALGDAEDQTDFSKMMAAVVQLFEALQAPVQSGVLPFEAAKSITVGFARKFRLGYEIEDQLDQMQPPPQQDPKQSPEYLLEQLKGENQIKVAQAKAAADAQADSQSSQARAMADIISTTIEAKIDANAAKTQAVVDGLAKALPSIIIQHLRNVGALGVARINAGVDAGNALLDHEEALGDQALQHAQLMTPPPTPSNGSAPTGPAQ